MIDKCIAHQDVDVDDCWSVLVNVPESKFNLMSFDGFGDLIDSGWVPSSNGGGLGEQ